jgi:hypothetical protein
VGFVHSEEPNVDLLEKGNKPIGEALRRHVQKLELPGAKLLHAQTPLFAGDLRVDGRRPNALFAQGIHLVLHECEQGRHHDGGPPPGQGRQLVAQRLSCSCGHHHQGIRAFGDVLADGPLSRAKRRKAEAAAQDPLKVTKRNTVVRGHDRHGRSREGRGRGR